MKIRHGFVSNSSSSSYILDLRKEGVKEIVKSIRASRPLGLGRCSALAVGKDAADFAQEWIDENEAWHGAEYDGLGYWIKDWVDKLGEDNVVFVRESDEGMGGHLFGEYDYKDNPSWEKRDTKRNRKIDELYNKFYELKEDEMEYH